MLSNRQLPAESQDAVLNGLANEHQAIIMRHTESERQKSSQYSAISTSDLPINNRDTSVMSDTCDKTQGMVQQMYPLALQQNDAAPNMNSKQMKAEKLTISPPFGDERPKKEKTPKKNRSERDKEKELKDKKNQIWQEREREWKLLQQQRQQESKRQQQQNPEGSAMSKVSRGKPSKTPDWRKPVFRNDSNDVTGMVASSSIDNTVQIQLSNYISSKAGDKEQQNTTAVAMSQTNNNGNEVTISCHAQTVVSSASVTSVEEQTTYWMQNSSGNLSNAVPNSKAIVMSNEGQSQNWLGHHEQSLQHSVLMLRQMSSPSLQQNESQEEGERHEQSAFNPSNIQQNPPQTQAINVAISPITESNVSEPASEYPLMMTQELSSSQTEKLHEQKQQEAFHKQQQIQQLQKQQQLQQQEVLQREHRKQLVLAQHQQQEYIQRQLKNRGFSQHQMYPSPQPPRQANQFTTSSKEMPEIDTEEEHQERLQFLYRQRQMQKRLMQLQQQASTTPSLWMNNSAHVMQGLSQGIPSDSVQQRLFIEQRISMEKREQQISNPFNQQTSVSLAPVTDQTSKFNFHKSSNSNSNDFDFPTPSQVTHTSINMSANVTQADAAINADKNTPSLFSTVTSGKVRKTARKDSRNSAVEFSSHLGPDFSNALEITQQRDGVSVNQSGRSQGDVVTVGHEICVTLDEGNARRTESAEKAENEKHEITINQATNVNTGKSLTQAYGASTTNFLGNTNHPQLVLPPPQLSLSPQQQHILLQAQQQQLLWQQAHTQLQHQYQMLYQQLQQLQIQLQQTQDPSLHQRVLRQQQQLRFLQTQILQHWQQGQVVVQQIHLQAFGLNALFNQMDSTQQKHVQIYQQELVRQQQQWAQKYRGMADIFSSINALPQDNRIQAVAEVT